MNNAISSSCQALLDECEMTAETVTLPARKLDAALFGEVKKVITAAGGKWKGRGIVGSYHFPRDPRTDLRTAQQSGKVVSTKVNTQAFYTPAAIVARVLAHAPTLEAVSALEPSAGGGAFADALQAGGATVVCVELDAHSASILSAKGHTVITGDFLECSISPAGYDVIVMNPPFSKGQDMQHVAHALKSLKPGGTLLAIMGTHFTFASSRAATDFRSLVDAHGSVVDSFPAGSFKESGTNVPTVLVKLIR